LDLSPNTLYIILAFLLTLGTVVVIHELGHFLFCKIFGVYVKTFSIGIGPKLLRKQWGETEYTISAIPFGGYVKMAGEGMMEEIQDTGTWEGRKYPLGTEEGNAEAASMDADIPPERLFFNRPAWQRLLVFIAGPLFNLVLAFLVFTGLILSQGLSFDPVTEVGQVREGSLAAEAGIQVGDVITHLDGKEVSSWDEAWLALFYRDPAVDPDRTEAVLGLVRDGTRFEVTLPRPQADGSGVQYNDLESANTTIGRVQKGGLADQLGLQRGDVITAIEGTEVSSFGMIAGIINERPGEETHISWLREGRVMTGTVTPELDEVAPGMFKGRIFIEAMKESRSVGLVEGVKLGWRQTSFTVRYILQSLWDLVSRKLGLGSVGGPLRIGQAAGDMLRWGFDRLMNFIAFFSVNLFLLNLLPIPVLDGGHVLFLLVEVVRGGKPVPERIQAIATQLGLIILLLFMTFVFFWDIWKVAGN
jgi:regulator of sigma E protease